jgi:uncharacterized protein YdaU (DUF1376 family)
MYYYKFNIADWHLATSHLSLEEEAIYFRLINYYYDTEQPIPEETQTVIRRLRLGSYSDTVMVILNEFFELSTDGWHHKRCDDEIHAYHLKAEKNQIVGKLGGRPKKIKDLDVAQEKTQTVSKDNPEITLTKNHKPLTKNHIKDITPEGVSESIFKDYLEVRKAKKAKWTQTALKGLQREADKAKMSLQDVIQLCCERNWVGFKAEWANSQNPVSKQGDDKSWMFSNQGIEAKAKELGVNDYGIQNHQQLKDKVLLVMAKKAMQ